MVRTSTNLPNTSLRRKDTPQWRASLGSYADIAMSDTRASQRESPSRGSSSLRVLREPDRRRRDEERPLPAPNKELAQNRKQPLDREMPHTSSNPLPSSGESDANPA